MYFVDKKGVVGYNWILGGEIWFDDWKELGVRFLEIFIWILVVVC